MKVTVKVGNATITIESDEVPVIETEKKSVPSMIVPVPSGATAEQTAWYEGAAQIRVDLETLKDEKNQNVVNKKGVELHNRLGRLKDDYTFLDGKGLATPEMHDVLVGLARVLLADVFRIDVSDDDLLP